LKRTGLVKTPQKPGQHDWRKSLGTTMPLTGAHKKAILRSAALLLNNIDFDWQCDRLTV